MASAAPFLARYPSDASFRRALLQLHSASPGSGLATPPVTAGPTVKTKPLPVKPAAPTVTKIPTNPLLSYFQQLFGTPLSAAEMQAAASKQAQADIAAIVSPYLVQEQRAAERAAATAAQIRDASQAVATSLEPLGDVTKKDYQDALDTMQRFASGFQGQIGADAQAEAAAAQAQFEKMGAPATATNLGGDLGNVLYALGGAIPASPLAAAGVAETMAARNLPGEFRAGGEQRALQASQAGSLAIQDIEDKIAAAQGQLPTLTQQYLQNFQEQASRDIASRISLLSATKPQIVGTAASGYRAIDPLTGRVYPGYVIPPNPAAAKGAAAVPFTTRTIVTGKNRDGLIQVTTNRTTGVSKMKVLQKPSDGSTSSIQKINGVPTVVTYDASGTIISQQAVTGVANKIERFSLGRGGYIETETNPYTGEITKTTVNGQPYPAQTFTNPDGTHTLVGYNPVTGKPFSITAGTKRIVPPTIKANKVEGGYDVFDTQTGNLDHHIPGPVNPKPVRIVQTPRQGGWDVVDSTTGVRIYHVKGKPQAGPTGSNAGVAYTRVNRVAKDATDHGSAKGFDLDKIGGTNSKLQVGTEKRATPFVTALTQALSVAPKTRKGTLTAIAIITGRYQPLVDEMTLYLASDQVQQLLAQATTPEARAQLATKVYQGGLQQGFPNDLLQLMVGTAFHTNAFGTEGTRFTPPEGTMPSFANPGDAAAWYINHVLDQIIPTGQTTAAGTGGGPSPFATSNVPAPLQTAILTASQTYGIDPNLMVAIWQRESGGKYPNKFVNKQGYGGLFGTTNWNGTPLAQANLAAKILSNQLKRFDGDMSKALYAYSGGSYSTLDYTPAQMDPSQVRITTEGKQTQLTRNAVSLIKTYLGTPYVWGGETPGGFDCSGLLQYVWAQQGVAIPRVTFDQWDKGMPIEKANLMPGDAVFFTGKDPRDGKPGHVGMYIGGGKFIEAPHSGAVVRISDMSSRSDYVGARRFWKGMPI